VHRFKIRHFPAPFSPFSSAINTEQSHPLAVQSFPPLGCPTAPRPWHRALAQGSQQAIAYCTIPKGYRARIVRSHRVRQHLQEIYPRRPGARFQMFLGLPLNGLETICRTSPTAFAASVIVHHFPGLDGLAQADSP
jgi:hypothetical protein